MRILSVASEIYPLIKTGGLADVAGALPPALGRRGIAMRTLMPGYPSVLPQLADASVVHEYDSLLGVPAAMVRALAELLSYESEGEGNVLDDVAERWAAEEDMPFGAEDARKYVQQLAELAGSVDENSRTGLYVWSS